MSFYSICMTFIIYSFLGWCAEVIFAAANHGTYINRGFLAGPVCPIYGFGMVIVKLLLDPMKDNFLLLFLGSVLLASILELITGFLMEKIFSHKWWDYSKEPFNIGGYICLKFSLLWGIGALAIIRGVDPAVQDLTDKIHGWFTIVIMVILLLMIAADFVMTLMRVNNFNKRVSELEDMYENVKRIADKLGRGMAEGTAAAGAEKDALEQKYRRLATDFTAKSRQIAANHSRLIKAFPSLSSRHCSNAVTRLKAAVKKITEETKDHYDE